MMALGSCGGASSSSSNLSASAPPFSIGRFNSKPNSNPLVHPPELEPDSTRYTPHTSYCPSFVEDSSSLTLTHLPVYHPSSQLHYNEHLSAVGYTPHWHADWKGNEIGSRGTSATRNLNQSSPFVFNAYINEDSRIQSGNETRGGSGNLYGLSTDGIQIASHAGSFNARISDGQSLFSKKHDVDLHANPIDGDEKDRRSKSFNTKNLNGLSSSFNMMNIDGESLSSQNLGHSPFESSGTQCQGPTSTISEFSPPGTFQGSSKCFINHQKTYGLQEWLSRPACKVVIKAPAKSTSSSARDTDKIMGNKLASSFGSKLRDIPHPSEENEYFMSTRPQSIEGSCYTNNSDREGYKYTKDPLDNHILALDSPCWKGSQAPRSSQNNIIELLPGIQFLKELDGCLDLSGNLVGLTGVASQDLSVGTPNFRTLSAANDEQPSQTSTSETSCAAKERNPDDAVKEAINCRNPQSPKDRQFLNNLDKPREEHNLSNNFLENETRYACSSQFNMGNGFAPVEVNLHAGTKDGVAICNEAADTGTVTYLSAENVLYSLPAQEVCEEHNQPSVEVATQIVDNSALVNAMLSLSEVLNSNCSANLCGLTEENQESLRCVIRKLDACVSRNIVGSTPVSECMVPQQSTVISSGDGGDLDKAKGADQQHQEYQATVTSLGELGHHDICNEKINCCDYSSHARSLPYFLPSEHNKRVSTDEKMVQALKKVLDENFNFEEEMPPQVILFKNLWLEAEARLCSISYLAHFDNMRILMDKYSKRKGITDDADKALGPKDSHKEKDTSLTAVFTEKEALVDGLITKQSSSSIDTIVDNVDKSSFSRFSAPFNDGDGFSPDEQHQPSIPRKTGEKNLRSLLLEGQIGSVVTPDAVGHVEDLQAAVLAKLNILKQRDGKSNEAQLKPSVLDTNNSGCQCGSSISTSNPESQSKHAEARVLARLNILKQRDDKPNEVQQQPNAHNTNNSGSQVNLAEAAGLARLNILRQRDIRPKELKNVYTTKAEGQLDSSICAYGYESLKDFDQGAINDQVTQPGRNCSRGHVAGSLDSPLCPRNCSLSGSMCSW